MQRTRYRYAETMRDAARRQLGAVSVHNVIEVKMEVYSKTELDGVLKTSAITVPLPEEVREVSVYEDRLVKFSRDLASISSFLPNNLSSPIMKSFAALDFVTDIRDFELCNNYSDYPQLYLVLDDLKEGAVEKVIRYLRKQKAVSVAFVQSEPAEEDLTPVQSVIAVATSRIVFLFTLQICSSSCLEYLKGMLTDVDVMKIVHNAAAFEKDLTAVFGVQLQPFFDVALTQQEITKSNKQGKVHSLHDLLRYYANPSSTFKELLRLNFPRLRLGHGLTDNVNEIYLDILERVMFLQAIQKYQLTALMKEMIGETEMIMKEVFVPWEAVWSDEETPVVEERYVQSVPERSGDSPVRVESATSTNSTASTEDEKEEWEDALMEHYSCGTRITVA